MANPITKFILLRLSDLGKGFAVSSQNVVTIAPSTDAGNGLTLGSDGGLFAGASGGGSQATPNYNTPITANAPFNSPIY